MFMPLAAVFLLCSSVILHAEDDSEALVSKESADAEEEAQTTIKESLSNFGRALVYMAS